MFTVISFSWGDAERPFGRMEWHEPASPLLPTVRQETGGGYPTLDCTCADAARNSGRPGPAEGAIHPNRAVGEPHTHQDWGFLIWASDGVTD
jgi:hypothetical protein